MQWLFPGMLAGLAACVAPVLIHLLLRPRPRVQVFPALHLLREVHRRTRHRQRLQHLFILLMRILALVLLATALARPVILSASSELRPRGSVAAAWLVDDSASMLYRFGGSTRLERGLAAARTLLYDAGRFPAGSRYWVMRTSDDVGGGWTEDRSTAFGRLRGPPRGLHDRGLAAGLAAAWAALREQSDLPGEIYIVSDLSACAFGGIRPARESGRDAVRTYVIDVGHAEWLNAAVGLPEDAALVRSPVVPQGRPFEVPVRVRAGDLPVAAMVELWLDGAVAARRGPVHVPRRQSEEISISAPGLAAGMHYGELRLEGGDSLPQDNVAWFAVYARPRLAVSIVTATDAARASPEAKRVATLLAPRSVPAERRPFDVRMIPSASLDAPLVPRPDVLIWVEPAAITPRRAAALRDAANEGAAVLLIAGPGLPFDAWRGLPAPLAATPLRNVRCDDPQSFIAADGRRASALLRDQQVYEYVLLDPAPTAEVALRFASGDPAVVEERNGRGRIAWWAFSLRPEWGDLGVRAAGALVWLHEFCEPADAPWRCATVCCDEAVVLSAPTGAADGTLVVQRITTRPEDAAPRRLRSDANGDVVVPTPAAGVFRITPALGRRGDEAASQPAAVGYCAVNLRPEETDGRRVAPDEVAGLVASARVVADVAELGRAVSGPAGDYPLDGVAAVMVGAMLLLEAALVRRTYASQSGAAASAG